jgi:hypothetical protein
LSTPAGRPRSLVAGAAAAAAAWLALAAALTRPSVAQTLTARETALVGPPGSYSVGVFNPLRAAFHHGFEIETQPLIFLISPNAVVRVAHLDRGARLRLTGEYGLSVPTFAMRLLQGHLFPTWHYGQQRVGWIVAPRAGLVGSVGDPEGHVVTLRMDLTVGVVLTHTDTMPLDTYAPLELLFAPVTGGYRGRLGAIYDRKLSPRWRLRGYADLYLHGSGELHDRGDSPFGSSPHATTRLGLGADVALGWRRTNRLTFGVAWWNYAQHEIDPNTFEARRSNDIFPTVDFIWAN